jgi:REP element-mobilizing transposase RayT
LPNDPRGSGSHTVETDVLGDLGELHYGRRRIQPPGQIVRDFYRAATPRLYFPVLRVDREQIELIAAAFSDVIRDERYTCYAGAIMPDHVHTLIRKHRDLSEQMIAKLQAKSRFRLTETDAVDADHPIWTGGGGWRVYLETPDDVRRTVRYIERNPRGSQQWPFVTMYDDWPFDKQTKSH